MSFTSWLRNLRSAIGLGPVEGAHRRQRSLRAATHRPRLELLEDRCTPSTYSVTDLGTLGGRYGYAADINASGQVASAVLANGEGHAVLWQNGVAIDLGTLGGTDSQATGINDAGQVVGRAALANEEVHAVLWQNGVATDLGTLGGTGSQATGINDAGQVVGTAYLTGDTSCHAFLITPVNGVYFQDADLDGRNDFMIDLGTLGGSWSSAAAINASGQVVGGADTADGDYSHAALWQNGVATDLGTLDGTFSGATGINDAGQVVGSAGVNLFVGYDYDENGNWNYGSPIYQEFRRAFLWQNGVMTELSPAYGYTDGIAHGINNAGQVVGQEWSIYSGAIDPGFLWQNEVTTDLAGQVPAGALVPDAAQAINDAGQIVGYGTSPADGSVHALLLTPNSSLGSFVITGPQAATAGDAVAFTVTAWSDSGTTVTDYTGTVSFSSSDWQAGLPAAYTFTAADQGVHAFNATLKTAGWQTIRVADTAYTGVTGIQSVLATAAAANRLNFYWDESLHPAGAAFNFVVMARDAFDNLATSYTGTVHFTSTDAAAVLPADQTFVAADHGWHQFTATFMTPGFQSLTATDTAEPAIRGTRGNIEVIGASTFTVAGFPSPVTAGVAGSFTVTAWDRYGNRATGYTGTVHFTSSDLQAVLPADYTFTAGDQGVHTFSATLKTAGTQSITARDTTTASVTGSQMVTVSAASRFTVSGFPSSTTAGVAGSFTVTAKDQYGNAVTGYIGTVHLTSSDPQAVLPGNYTFTAADAGMHTFSATLKTAGYQSLTAKDIASAAISGAQGSILVNPAAASRLVLSAPTSVKANAAFSLTVTVLDAYGNVVTGYRGTLSFSSSDATATLPKNYTFTASDQGTHTFTNLRLKKKGKQTITVTDTLDSSIMASAIVDVV
jgi:probable HAF family extracellular repeat protein